MSQCWRLARAARLRVVTAFTNTRGGWSLSNFCATGPDHLRLSCCSLACQRRMAGQAELFALHTDWRSPVLLTSMTPPGQVTGLARARRAPPRRRRPPGAAATAAPATRRAGPPRRPPARRRPCRRARRPRAAARPPRPRPCSAARPAPARTGRDARRVAPGRGRVGCQHACRSAQRHFRLPQSAAELSTLRSVRARPRPGLRW